jgi:hypothetical protein
MGHGREGADKEERSRPGLQAVSHHAAKLGDLVPLEEEAVMAGTLYMACMRNIAIRKSVFTMWKTAMLPCSNFSQYEKMNFTSRKIKVSY